MWYQRSSTRVCQGTMPRWLLAWCTLCCLAQQFLAHPSAAEELRSLIVELGLGAHEGALRAESILTAQDLALLSADDMAGIGLTVGAKNRLLAWQRREQCALGRILGR